MKMVSVKIVLLNGDAFKFNRYSPREFVTYEFKKAIASGVVEASERLFPASSILYIDIMDVEAP
jgi:hypothetical protein